MEPPAAAGILTILYKATKLLYLRMSWCKSAPTETLYTVWSTASPCTGSLTRYNQYPTKTPGGGRSHVKAYRDVLPKWVTFSSKILKHGPHFGQKILRESHFTKIVKPAVFEAEKPLQMGLDLQKFRKKCLISRFLSEKNP